MGVGVKLGSDPSSVPFAPPFRFGCWGVHARACFPARPPHARSRSCSPWSVCGEECVRREDEHDQHASHHSHARWLTLALPPSAE
eukprot:3724390-Rhodomonas_salina.1